MTTTDKDKSGRQKKDPERTNRKDGGQKLLFVRELMKANGFTYKMIAERTGKSPQSISWAFKTDDTTLNLLKDMCRAMRYDLDVEFVTERKPLDLTGMTDVFIVEEDADDDTTAEDMINYGIRRGMDYFRNSVMKNDNMAFVARLAIERGMTMADFAKLLGMSYQRVQAWFRYDRIGVSNIYQIATKTGAKVKWTLKRTGA